MLNSKTQNFSVNKFRKPCSAGWNHDSWGYVTRLINRHTNSAPHMMMWKFIAPPKRQAALTSTVPSPGIEPPTFSLRSVKLSPRKQPRYTERMKTTKQTTGENREDASWHSSGVTYAALTCQPSASFGGLDEPRYKWHRRVAYSKQAWACSGCRYHNDHREFKLLWVEELALFWVSWRDVGNTETSAHRK